MKRMVVLAFFLLAFSVLAYAAVPHLINYQGRLTDTNSQPLNGSYNLTFRIYDTQSAGNLLWEETQNGVVIQKGIFNVLLGSVTNLNLAFDKPYFLEIKVGNEVMSPRQQITSAAYALKAESADSLTLSAQKGDVLYFDGTNWTRLPAGNQGQALITNGAGQNPFWGAGGGFNHMQAFTTSGTWVKPAGVNKVYVKVWGAGGSGSTTGSAFMGGGGGGGGGYSEGMVSVVNNANVVVGSGSYTNDGGSSSFTGVITLTANGGSRSKPNDRTGGVGGSAIGGDLNLSGGTGGVGGNAVNGSEPNAGAGGGSPFGGAGGSGGPSRSGGNGAVGTAPGGGGGGGSCGGLGASGANGLVIVYWSE